MRNLEEIDDLFVQKLDDKSLVNLDKELHALYKKLKRVTEPLHNAHIFVWTEMRKRGLKHDIRDPLTFETALEVVEYFEPSGMCAWRSISLEEALEAFPQDILVKEDPVHLYLTGRIVNEGKIPEDHDIDICVKQRYPDRRIVESLVSAVYKQNPEIAKRLHIFFDPEGPLIGLTIPLYRLSFSKISPKDQRKRDPDSYLAFGLKRAISAQIKVMSPHHNMKPRSGFHKYEFWDLDELWQKWGIDHIDNKIYVQEKYDGMYFQVHRKGDQVRIFTEDRARDRASVFKKSVEELPRGEFILHAEMVEYKDKPYSKALRREQMIPWITAKKEMDDKNVVFHVHDITWLDGQSLAEQSYDERYLDIKKVLPKKLTHWERVPSETVGTKKEFYKAVNDARNSPNSEGAMLKDSTGVYSLTGRTSEMAKIKNLKEIDVMIGEITPKKTAEGKPLKQWVYECFFKVPCTMKDKVREADWLLHDKSCYARIGTSYSTAERAKVGDIIIVRPVQILENKDPNGKLYWTWMFPFFEGKHPVRKEADTLTTVRRIVKVGTSPFERTSLSFKPLAVCPYYKDGRICILKEKFVAPIGLRKQGLRFPIRCKLANIYRCPYVKRYYYTWKEEEKTSRTYDFVLHKHYGNPKMKDHWDIRWKISSTEKHEFHLRENPIGKKRVLAYLLKRLKESPESIESWMIHEGKHLTRYVRGVGKTFIDVLDSGRVEVEEKDKEIFLSFQGKHLKGNYILKKEKKDWSFTKEKS